MTKIMVDNLIAEIESVTQQSLASDADARVRLLSAAQSLCIRLEAPFEFVQRITWQEPSLLMCLKVADDIGLFKYIGVEGSASKSVEELATATSVEPELLKRIARHLAARCILKEEIPEELSEDMASTTFATATPTDRCVASLGSYAATHISAALMTREGGSGVRQACNVYYPNFLAMPALLRERAYASPKDNRDGPFQRRHGLVGKTTFECMQLPEYRALADDFNLLMKFTTSERRSFLDVCDVDALIQSRPYPPLIVGLSREDRANNSCHDSIEKDNDKTGHLLVDVGGGTGTDALAFRNRFSNISGKVELQELPAVVDTAAATVAGAVKVCSTSESGSSNSYSILLRAHDFFSPQPVFGPRFFFLGSVLHDWPDIDAIRILQHLAAAMKPGYSTLLLSENVLRESSTTNRGSHGGGIDTTEPPQKHRSGAKYSKCHPHLSAIDLTMMTSLAAKERSERDWSELLAIANLQIVKIHSTPLCLKSVLECELSV